MAAEDVMMLIILIGAFITFGICGYALLREGRKEEPECDIERRLEKMKEERAYAEHWRAKCEEEAQLRKKLFEANVSNIQLEIRAFLAEDSLKKLEAENATLKRQIEWMQAEIDRLNIEHIKETFGTKN